MIGILLKIIEVTRKVKWIGFLAIIVGIFVDHPILDWTKLLFLLIFIDPVFYVSLLQIFGMLYTRIIHRFKLPSKETYACETDYILPFIGKWSVMNGGVTKTLSHSWGILSQRYAYDFLILDGDGKSFDRDSKTVQDYYCYGQEIVAPADGIVVNCSNVSKDSRVNGRKAFCDAWDIRGNFIVIKHNEKEYSAIAHIAPGSISVKVGDAVKRGDVIAKCGNSGNTSEPHIHFQLQTGKSFYLSASLPIAFTNIHTQDSAGYNPWHERIGIKPRTTEGNLEVIGSKCYIGRGLDVENIPINEESEEKHHGGKVNGV